MHTLARWIAENAEAAIAALSRDSTRDLTRWAVDMPFASSVNASFNVSASQYILELNGRKLNVLCCTTAYLRSKLLTVARDSAYRRKNTVLTSADGLPSFPQNHPASPP